MEGKKQVALADAFLLRPGVPGIHLDLKKLAEEAVWPRKNGPFRVSAKNIQANMSTKGAQNVVTDETFCGFFRLYGRGENKLNVAEQHHDDANYKTTAPIGRPAKPLGRAGCRTAPALVG
jgi:hypothetical protein